MSVVAVVFRCMNRSANVVSDASTAKKLGLVSLSIGRVVCIWTQSDNQESSVMWRVVRNMTLLGQQDNDLLSTGVRKELLHKMLEPLDLVFFLDMATILNHNSESGC
ncbi:hypothetical protein ACRALDRAFT_2031416 [Sodiomyces alcalophilus JCM 7366]|uniref:uncharacterized protein n=1 Tax=Sodiomyces alcalophilus JCM 7366 TaxID=591952 RepID=UPI0039B4F007